MDSAVWENIVIGFEKVMFMLSSKARFQEAELRDFVQILDCSDLQSFGTF